MTRAFASAFALMLLAAACGDGDAREAVASDDTDDDSQGTGGAAGSVGADDDETGTQHQVDVAVDILDGEDATPTWYRAIFTDETGTVSAISCPSDEPSGPIDCSATGVHLSGSNLPLRLTVKAQGYAFVTQELQDLEPTHGQVEVRLAALEPFEHTARFATGFDATEQSVAFEELAVSRQTELGLAHSLKFYIDGLDGAPQIYFQNTRQFLRHIDFVQQGLGLPISDAEFENMTQGPDRTAMVGTLISRPELTVPVGDAQGELAAPVTLEFFPSDELSPEQALVAHRLLEERLQFLSLDGGERRLVYVPASDRAEADLVSETAQFLESDARFVRFTGLYAGVTQQVLNPGLSYGTLRLFTPEELRESVVSWRDIVVLTRLPNGLPLVGGTITEELQTPLAHVNIAARARGTPNLALVEAAADPRIQPLLDDLVRFEVTDSGFSVEAATLEDAEAFWAEQAREPFVPESDTEYLGLPSFDEIGFTDAVRVGVKAANVAELHQLLGDRAPRGFAVPFSAFDAYMRSNLVADEACTVSRGACTNEGRASDLCDAAESLCQAGAEAGDSFYAFLDRLFSDASFRSDTALREACLAGFRSLVEHGEVDTEFARALDARTAEIFGDDTVRLRSSTNVEDLADFSGAGLYESVSAEATGVRASSSRIRAVWASTWTFAAFEERSLWNVDESAVRMGVAVNQAFGEEEANGVLITKNLSSPGSPGYYVNVQLGELSVTNPENGATPEVLTLVPVDDERWETVRQRYSSESPDRALLSDSESQALATAASEVLAHLARLYGLAPQRCALDIEFKLLPPERALVIKQVRPYNGVGR